jgi:hypothetical protein
MVVTNQASRFLKSLNEYFDQAECFHTLKFVLKGLFMRI